jgi:hypothetical protein
MPWLKTAAEECERCAERCGRAAAELEARLPKPPHRVSLRLEEAVASCLNTATMLARGSRYAAQACALTAEACDKLAEALLEFDREDAVIKECAGMCEATSRACRVVTAREARAAVGLAG